ncbi:hypothetical protein EAH78_13385 [Pseudomonas arsenicoxydans]|uniref:Uncharacterized protein n=1 Tax=Pseudomonas arsenicoxydans TaxID=702115 RepID=A0A502HXA8_9PSED|nr:hypothetical protein EAH78_13385 [Pseudomonas arsenicoxydans]
MRGYFAVLWRGSLLPLGREAAPIFTQKEGPAAQSSGSKLPRHKGWFSFGFCCQAGASSVTTRPLSMRTS